jgi:hypothetical protein
MMKSRAVTEMIHGDAFKQRECAEEINCPLWPTDSNTIEL